MGAGDVVALLEGVLSRPEGPHACRDFALTALMKLSVRYPDQAARIQVGAASSQPCFAKILTGFRAP